MTQRQGRRGSKPGEGRYLEEVGVINGEDPELEKRVRGTEHDISNGAPALYNFPKHTQQYDDGQGTESTRVQTATYVREGPDEDSSQGTWFSDFEENPKVEARDDRILDNRVELNDAMCCNRREEGKQQQQRYPTHHYCNWEQHNRLEEIHGVAGTSNMNGVYLLVVVRRLWVQISSAVKDQQRNRKRTKLADQYGEAAFVVD